MVAVYPRERELFGSKALYSDARIAALEREKVWPRTWLMACRLENVSKPGDFYVFDIDQESILIVNTGEGGIRAYYNVCQHRGRRLKERPGNTGTAIFCPFHGWRWKVTGELDKVVNEEDFADCDRFDRSKLSLKQVKVDTWGGFVFVCMDSSIEPLIDYLGSFAEIVNNFEFAECRNAWSVTLVFPCNWKTVTNAFNENYHVETTHAQINKYGLTKSPAKAHGRHAQFFVQATANSSTLGDLRASTFKDMIDLIERREQERHDLLHALVSEYALAATHRLREVASADWAPKDIVKKYRELHREEMEKCGAKWPSKLTDDDVARAGVNWHVFPNFILLPSFDGALYYRSRPNPQNAEECFFDIGWMQRYAPGKEPSVTHKVYTLEEFKGLNPFLEQDFANLIGVQRGMKSRGFGEPVYNPVQETEITNFERVLNEYFAG